VRAYYTAQTLEQMHNAVPLTLDRPPAKADIFIPGCSTGAAGYPCDWKVFQQAVSAVIDPAFVNKP
jgi:4-phytase/acid phosphatase